MSGEFGPTRMAGMLCFPLWGLMGNFGSYSMISSKLSRERLLLAGTVFPWQRKCALHRYKAGIIALLKNRIEVCVVARLSCNQKSRVFVMVL